MLWEHYCALRENRRDAAARRALATAYAYVSKRVRKITDEGLLRNYLSKNPNGSKIVPAYTKEWLARKHAAGAKPLHLAVRGNLREPFERLAEAGLRLNEIRSTAELTEFLIDEATEISGAQRVLLILESSNVASLAGFMVPSGEDATTLWREVEPSLADVRRSPLFGLGCAGGAGVVAGVDSPIGAVLTVGCPDDHRISK